MLNSGFWKGKILKSAKIWNSGCWKVKMFKSVKTLIHYFEIRNLKESQNQDFGMLKS